MIPIIFGSVAFGHLTYKQILGYPTELSPVGEYRLISFHIVPKTDIYLWILESEKTIPRAYRVDYSTPNRKKLSGFRKLLEAGDAIIINFLKKGVKGKRSFEIYKFPRPSWLKKDDG